MNHFFAIKFYIHFSENLENVTGNGIFPLQKTLKKYENFTFQKFELLRRAFIHRDQAFKRVPKIMQNYAKMHRKSPQNEHEKMWIAVLQWSETHVVASPAKMHQNAFIFVFPGVALLTPWIQKRLKSSKIIDGGMHGVYGRARREAG